MSLNIQKRVARLGFLGVGWIGLNRLKTAAELPETFVAAVADLNPVCLDEALSANPDAIACDSLDDLLAHDLDGIVIATPSALHAEHAIRALEAGCAVFCQKPLARTAEETAHVLDIARREDRLLGVDFSYRYTQAVQALIHQKAQIGDIYSVELTFHNAYGPDKDWFYDVNQSGGGCVIDLGIHLIDLVLWALDQPTVENIRSRLFAHGQPLKPGQVEDYASVTFDLNTGASVRLSCSWNLPAGCDAVIEAIFYGTEGALKFYNTDGGFYNFAAAHLQGTHTQMISTPPDDWGGRAIQRWVRQLVTSPRFDPAITSVLHVADVIDRIYGYD